MNLFEQHREQAQKLREETKVNLLECVKALIMYEGDEDKAREHLLSGKWKMGKLF